MSTTTSPASIPTRASSPRFLTRVEDPERGADRALGVVLVRLGDAERGEHRVAGELLDDPAVRGHAVRDVVEEPRHAAADDLRIAGSDKRRRIDEIDEQDGCKLALHASSVETNEGPDSIRGGVLDPKVSRPTTSAASIRASWTRKARDAIGRAYVEQFAPKRIAVGRDMRLSSPTMAEAVIEGATAAGAEVLDIGLVGTEMVYFAVGELGLDGGVMVTASHNPKEYTGMKIVRAGRAARRRGLGPAGRARPGHVRGQAPATCPAGHGARVRHLARIRRPCVVVRRRVRDPAAEGRDRRGERHGRHDAAAGARAPADRGGAAATSSRTGASRTTSRTRCCQRTASSSSGRRSRRAPTSALRSTATPTGASSSTTRGEFVAGDFATALFAEGVLEKEPGAKIIYDVRASWAVPETIERAGGDAGRQPGRARVHQAADARGATPPSEARSRATTTSATSRRPTPASSRSCVMLERISKGGGEALRAAPPVPRALLHHRRDQHARRRRPGEARASSRSVSGRRAQVSHLDGLSVEADGLALQRPALEHRAPAAAQPRGALPGADGAQARRGARGDP